MEVYLGHIRAGSQPLSRGQRKTHVLLCGNILIPQPSQHRALGWDWEQHSTEQPPLVLKLTGSPQSQAGSWRGSSNFCAISVPARAAKFMKNQNT